MAFILTCSVFYMLYIFFPHRLGRLLCNFDCCAFFLHSYIDVTVAYKFIVDIKCILYLCPYLVLSLLYLYACGINTYLDTSKRCIICLLYTSTTINPKFFELRLLLTHPPIVTSLSANLSLLRKISRMFVSSII